MATQFEEPVLQCVSQEEVFQLVWQLVSIPSYPEVGDQAVAKWLQSFFEKEGLLTYIQPVEGTKHFNVVVEVPGTQAGFRLLLNGHLDTVPLPSSAQAPRVAQGKLYGRGATDMKGAIAAMAMALVALHRARVPLRYGVLFTGVAGEEIGGVGTKAFLEAGGRAEMAIVGEPTKLRLVAAHKGVEWIKVELEGRLAHASCPEEGINAISWGAKVVCALEDWAARCRAERSHHSLLGPPTLSMGTIEGGVAPNVVANRCVIRMDRRWLPNETIEQIYKKLRDIISQTVKNEPRVRFYLSRMEETKHCIPMETPLNHSLIKTVQRVLADDGLSPEPQGVSYGTDASWLCQFGIPTAVWGPGDIRQAHSDNEFVDLNQVWSATRLYLTTVLRLCSANGEGTEGKK